MKKLLYSLLALGTTCLILALTVALPMFYHQVVHKEIVPSLVGNANIELRHKEVGFFEQNTSFEILATNMVFKVSVSTHTSVNPLGNYIAIQITDPFEKIKLDSKFYFDGDIVFEADEFLFANINQQIKAKKFSFKIEDFSLADIESFLNNPPQTIAEHEVEIEFESLALSKDEIKIEATGAMIDLAPFKQGDDFIYDMQMSMKSAFLKNQEQEVSAKEFELQTSIKKLDYKKFMPVVSAAMSAGVNALNMKAMLSLFQALKFPLTFSLNHELKLRDIPSQIKVDLALSSNNFFDPKQYDLSFFYDFAKLESTELMASFIAISAAKTMGVQFKNTGEKTREEIFLGSNKARNKLSNVLFKLFYLKQNELMQHSLGLGLLTDNEKTYLTKLKLKDGVYKLNSQEISKRELFRLPKTIAQKIIMSSRAEFQQLLDEHDLVPRK